MSGNQFWFVYTLRDCEGNIRYVGCSCNPHRRYSAHKSNKESAVGKWMRSEIAAGRDVVLSIEEKHDSHYAAYSKEEEYIRKYSVRLGDQLLNISHARPRYINRIMERIGASL